MLDAIMYNKKSILLSKSVHSSAGLGSILFAITIDRPELNRAHHQSNNVHVNNTADQGSAPDIQEEPHAVIAGDNGRSLVS